MSEAVGSTLAANLTQIMGELAKVKESDSKRKSENDEKVNKIQEKYDQ